MPSTAAHSLTPPPIPMTARVMDERVWAPANDCQSVEERLFELRRDAIAASTGHLPLARVAALLVSIATNNSYEGRDPWTVPETLSSGFVADLVGLSVDGLAEALHELEARGLVEAGEESSLRLKDLPGLSELAGAH